MKLSPKVFSNRILLVVLMTFFLASCKTGQTGQSTGEHFEDLSYLRPEVEVQEEQTPDVEQEEVEEVYIPEPSLDISEEVAEYSDKLAERQKAQGYTRYYIQVYSGNNRSRASQASSLVSSKFPSYKPVTDYVQPNFKVRIGNFLEKIEAYPVYKAVRSEFPSAVLIPERVRP